MKTTHDILVLARQMRTELERYIAVTFDMHGDGTTEGTVSVLEDDNGLFFHLMKNIDLDALHSEMLQYLEDTRRADAMDRIVSNGAAAILTIMDRHGLYSAAQLECPFFRELAFALEEATGEEF